MQAFRAELAELMKKVDSDFAALEKRQAPAIPALLEANRRLTRTDLGVNRFAGGGSREDLGRSRASRPRRFSPHRQQRLQQLLGEFRRRHRQAAIVQLSEHEIGARRVALRRCRG